MIKTATFEIDDEGELDNAVMIWDQDIEDYTFEIPKGISRSELIDLIEEIKHVTYLND